MFSSLDLYTAVGATYCITIYTTEYIAWSETCRKQISAKLRNICPLDLLDLIFFFCISNFLLASILAYFISTSFVVSSAIVIIFKTDIWVLFELQETTMFCLLGGGGSAAVVEASLPFLFQRSSRPPFFSALQLVWLHGLIRQLNCEVLDLITVGIQIAPSLGLVDISFLSKSTRVRYVSPFHIRR